ncbi:MAG: hypothetical protein H7333_11050 [Bdellovibrionales bacterium]|nr:hypothetical protein [Oligoflexia bacterium]
MERNHTDKPAYFHRKIHAILSWLQKRGFKTKSDSETLKTARGLTSLFFAIGLAWASLEITQNQSVMAYRSSHWPQQRNWEETLEHRGLKRREELNHYGKLLETHPAPFAQERMIWATADFCVIYLPQSPYRPSAELWTCDESTKAFGWARLGAGLKGFEAMIDQFEKMPKKSVILSKTIAKFIDPKEFHY